MAQLNPYLNFNGKCQEAMNFYKECLGGELIIQKLAESPMAAQMKSEDGASVLHSILSNNGLVLMGSDMMGTSLIHGNEVGLCLVCHDEEEIKLLFANLSLGGKIKMPLHQSFWGATYGELTDKFGLNWMFNYTRV